MTPPLPPPAFERVLLHLEADGPQAALLETAARLARALELALVGLYVEDADLVAFADLPIARQVTRAAADIAGLNQSALARHFENEQARLRRELTRTAAREQVRHEFLLRRGRPHLEIGRAVLPRDILVVGARRPAPLTGPAGLLACAAEALLLVPERPRAGTGPVAVAMPDGDPLERLVGLAARIAWRQNCALSLPAGGDNGRRARLRDLAAALPEEAARLVAAALETPPPAFGAPLPTLLVADARSAEAVSRQWMAAGVPVLVVKPSED